MSDLMNDLLNGLLTVLLCCVGVYLSMRCIAALHRIVDLGYAFGREKWRITRGIAAWGGATLLLLVMLPAPWEGLFVMSVVGYALLYVALWSTIRIFLALRWRRLCHARSALDDGRHAHASRGADGDQSSP